jgi:polar amino acid transport system substrate-binding protein
MKLIKAMAGAVLMASTAIAALGPAQAEARSLDEVLSSKKLIVGINPNFPPLGIYNDKNQIDGFDVEVSRKIAKMLGVELEIVPVGSPDRIPFVISNKIDAVMGAMTRTDERAKVIDFTVPVHTEVLGVLTTKDKPYKEWTDLNDPSVRMVEVRGATPVKLVQEQLPKAQLLLLDNYPDAVRALAQGRADAMIDVLDFMREHTDKHTNVQWHNMQTPIDVYYCGMGVQKGNTTLAARLNEIIKELHNNGFIDEKWEKWFGGPMLHDPRSSPYYNN